jgi:membrane-bound lytic murein transglycosylase B
MLMEFYLKCILLLIGFMFTLTSVDADTIQWENWLKDLRQEAAAKEVKPQLFDRIFNTRTPSKRHIQLDRSQPETRLTFYKYRDTRGDQYRIKLGRQEYKRYEDILEEVGKQYGVNPCFIVALWGLESSYGRFMGSFDVIRSLATLAYDGRRSEFFRKELLLALKMVNDGHVALEDFKGEWAGGSGHPQFLPSSWNKHAVDYDLDGRKDIWKTHADVFASIANYLHQNGWQAGQPVMVTVTLPDDFDQNLLGYKQEKTVREWQQLGVRIKPHQGPVDTSLRVSIVQPYGGPILMAFNNFKVLLKWNYSSFYAGTVNYVAEQICQNRLTINLSDLSYHRCYCQFKIRI